MDEMRQLVRILVKLMPKSLKFIMGGEENGGGNKITESQVGSCGRNEFLKFLGFWAVACFGGFWSRQQVVWVLCHAALWVHGAVCSTLLHGASLGMTWRGVQHVLPCSA